MTDRTALAEAELEYQDAKHAQHLRQFSDGLGGAGKLVEQLRVDRMARHDLDDDAMDLAGERRDRRASRADLRWSQVRRAGDRSNCLDHPGGRPGRQGHGSRWNHRLQRRSAAAAVEQLEHSEYRHPFIDRVSPIVLANYVSVTDGTGLVHTAPGHGAEDYQTGRVYQLSVLSPVDESGRFTSEAPDWLVGQQVFAANPVIIARLQESGLLHRELPLEHSYPHCWRCKKPVIFRATEQWFIAVDHNDLRGRTMKAIGEVQWLPDWGRTRIEAMVSLRPDWCISRQRSWGVPIPALGCTAVPDSATDSRDRSPFPRPVSRCTGPTLGSLSRSSNCSHRERPAPPAAARRFERKATSWTSGSSRAPATVPSWARILDWDTRPSCISRAPISTVAGSSRPS